MSFADRIEKGRFIPELKQGAFSRPGVKYWRNQNERQKCTLNSNSEILSGNTMYGKDAIHP